MTEILKCPMCGSTADVYATAASEMYGHAYQWYGVQCNGELDEHCTMSVGIDADFFGLDVHDSTVIELWNKVACLKR